MAPFYGWGSTDGVKENRYKYLTMNSILSNNECEYLTKIANN